MYDKTTRANLPYVNLGETDSKSKVMKPTKYKVMPDGKRYVDKIEDRAKTIRELKAELEDPKTSFERKFDIYDEMGLG
jgi:hypothetical protein